MSGTDDRPDAAEVAHHVGIRSVYLLLDTDGQLVRTAVVNNWDDLHALDREARDIRGMLAPLNVSRDYR